MSERRQHTRHKSFLRGCLYYNNRRSAVDCLVRDMSEAGARLIFSSAVTVPDYVDLYIPQREQMLRAHVQWRKGEEMGVTLVDAELRDGGLASEHDLAKRVEKFEAEVAALRKLVKRLKAEVSPEAEDAA
jgi:PilZ domain